MNGEWKRQDNIEGSGQEKRFRNAEKADQLKVLLEDDSLFQSFLNRVEENTQLTAPKEMKGRILARAEAMETDRKKMTKSKKNQMLWYGIKVGMGMAAAVIFTFSINFTTFDGSSRQNISWEQSAGAQGERSGGLFTDWLREKKQNGGSLIDGLERTVKSLADSLNDLVSGTDEEDTWK